MTRSLPSVMAEARRWDASVWHQGDVVLAVIVTALLPSVAGQVEPPKKSMIAWVSSENAQRCVTIPSGSVW